MGFTIPQLSDSDTLDLIKSLQPEVPQPDFTVVCQDYQDYFGVRMLMNAEEQSGAQIEMPLMTEVSSNAQMTSLYEPTSVGRTNVMKMASFQWAFCQTAYTIERRELLMNSSKKKVFNLMKSGRISALLGLAKLIEDQLWQYPTAANTKDIWGVRYWVVKNATEGFNGAAASGFTNVGGINPSTVTNWKNYSGAYSSVADDGTSTDAIQMLRLMQLKINFKAPVIAKDAQWSPSKRRMFVNADTLLKMENVAKSNNESLGFDISPLSGKATYNRNPIEYVPYLDNDTIACDGTTTITKANPIYMIDESAFGMYVLSGDKMRESDPQWMTGQGQHNVMVTFYDNTLNCGCNNRKCQGVISLNA